MRAFKLMQNCVLFPVYLVVIGVHLFISAVAGETHDQCRDHAKIIKKVFFGND